MSTQTPPRTPAGPAGAPRVRRLNVRALATLAAVLLVVGAALAAVLLIRGQGMGDPVAEARARIEAGQPDLAISYLNEALDRDPVDVEALDLKSELLIKAGGQGSVDEAIKLCELALRQGARLDAETARKLRRRLIELNLALGAYEPSRYGLALTQAKALVDADEGAGKVDAEALRLAGLAAEAVASSSNQADDLDRAVAYYEQGRAADPADPVTAGRLAMLYLLKKGDPARGEAVLEALLGAAPDSHQAHLLMHNYQAELALRAERRGEAGPAAAAYERADDELARAIELKGDDEITRVTAAEYALRRGQPEVARGHLEVLPEAKRKAPAVSEILGRADLLQNRTAQAIEDWRSGLIQSQGTDAQLTLRLAVVLLKLGRVAEAEPLVAQYRRLTGTEDRPDTPIYLYLDGLMKLKKGEPAKAAEVLRSIGVKAPEAYRPEIYLTLGQAYEATRDVESALEAYSEAIKADPRMPAPRLARIRVLQARQPEQADEELRQALAALGDEPSLLIAQARDAYREQMRRPAGRRDWAQVEALIERAAAQAPAASGLVLLQADLLDAQGRPRQEAIDLLTRATAVQKSDAELWLARAERVARAGEPKQALDILEQATAPEAAGDQAGLRIARARLQTLLGQGQQARKQLIENVDALPADQRPTVWAALGDLYAQQREPEEARKAYQQWAALLPSDPLPHLFLMEQALARGDQEAAQAEVKAIKELGGDGLFWRIARVQELLRGEPGDETWAEAGALIDQVEAEAPDQRYGPLLRGQLLEREGKKAEAAAAYEDALGREGGRVALGSLIRLYTDLKRPADLERLRRLFGGEVPNLDRTLAEAAVRQGDPERAEQLAARLAEADPGSIDVRVWQARLLNTIGKPKEAEEALRALVAQKPEALEPRLALLVFLAGQQRADEAARVAQGIVDEVKGIERPALVHAQCWRLAGQAAKADAAYAEALKADPDDPRVLRALAEHYETTGRPEAAEALLGDFLKRKPSERWAARALALLRSARIGDLEAWREARSLLLAGNDPAVDPDSPEERLARGIVLARGPEQAHRDEAKQILSSLVLDLPADYPTAPTARTLLLELYAQSGQYAEAAEVAAVDARAATAAAAQVARYASLLIEAGQLDKAAEQVARLEAAAAPELGVAQLAARLLKAQGKPDEAAARLAKSLDVVIAQGEAGKPAARSLLAAQLALDPVAAEALARRMAEAWPETRWMIASTLARQGKAEEAMAAYRDAAATAAPSDLVEIARNALAAATEEGKQTIPDAAKLILADEVLDALIARDATLPDLLVLKGYVRHFQEQYAEEVQLYRRALELNPRDQSFLNNLAWSLSEGLGQPEQALPIIEQLFQKSRKVFPQFYDTRGVILTRLGRLDEAIADLERAVEARPIGTTYAHLARAYHQAGRADDFAGAKAKALELGLTLEALEPSDRKDLGPLIFGKEAEAPAGS